MNATKRSTLALLAGVAIGVAGTAALQAQQGKPLPAYAIANIEVLDPAAYAQYTPEVAATMTPFHVRFLARSDKVEALEGVAPKRVGIIAFDSMDDVKKWRSSAAYQKLQPLREKAVKYVSYYAVEALPEAAPPAVGSSTPPAK